MASDANLASAFAAMFIRGDAQHPLRGELMGALLSPASYADAARLAHGAARITRFACGLATALLSGFSGLVPCAAPHSHSARAHPRARRSYDQLFLALSPCGALCAARGERAMAREHHASRRTAARARRHWRLGARRGVAAGLRGRMG